MFGEKNVHRIKGNYMTWKLFKKHIKQKYLTELYYDEKDKEFNDMKLGQMTIDEFVTKFFSLQRYVPYLIEEK